MDKTFKRFDAEFYKGKRILITGHTGFKGAWMCKVLVDAGAVVTGYALEPPTEPSLFDLLGLSGEMNSVIGDVRDLEHLKKTFDEAKPEIVIHMAAQPLVRESYANPVYTYETNVMGTVNVLEAIRGCETVKSFVNVTTDKVYRNFEVNKGYVETDELNGYDPYSNSKSCSELVTSSYMNSFFNGDNGRNVAISTCRAGNVIGGGDFAKDRIIPDCVKAASLGEEIIVRNPNSTRPYQHVLEPVCAYLMVAKAQYEDASFAGNYNVGPDDTDALTTGELATIFCASWGEGASWKSQSDNGPHEANFLKLDCTKLKNTFDWTPGWNASTAVSKVVEWSKNWIAGGNVSDFTAMQINEFIYR